MPNFLDTFDDTGTVTGIEFDDLSPFVQGYIQAAFFTNEATGVSMVEWLEPENQEALAEGQLDGELPTDAGFSDLHPDTLARLHTDCSDFEAKARHLLSQAYARGYTRDQAGRDFWFTRCGHGVGFWDRDILDRDDLGEKLSDVAKEFGNLDAYFDSDETSPTGYGFVHLS